MKRQLTREEAALWSRVARTVRPMPKQAEDSSALPRQPRAGSDPIPRIPVGLAVPGPQSPPRGLEDHRSRPQTLDASWDRRLAQGLVAPEFTIDLHGHSLAAAHSRLEHGLALALAQGARLALLVTGRARPADGEGGRSERRGAIRAKFADWLSAGPHASRIAAIRPAHPRHGGAGAVYLVLRRAR